LKPSAGRLLALRAGDSRRHGVFANHGAFARLAPAPFAALHSTGETAASSGFSRCASFAACGCSRNQAFKFPRPPCSVLLFWPVARTRILERGKNG